MGILRSSLPLQQHPTNRNNPHHEQCACPLCCATIALLRPCYRAPGAEMIRILVVDDYVDFRQAYVALLDGQPDLEVVSQAGSLAEARTMLEGVDVAFLDRSLPDGDGL